MSAPRSPNYPAFSLAKAIELLRPVFKAENRNKMSSLVLAKHLGSNTLNGRVLGRIGALRAYGLMEGRGEELRVSDDGLTLLSAPLESPDRQMALERCAFRPPIFAELRNDIPDVLNSPPSAENLRYLLVKRGYGENAAEKAAKSFRITIGLVTGNASLYDSGDDDRMAGDNDAEVQSPNGGKERPRVAAVRPASVVVPPQPGKGKLMDDERELTSGLLAKGTDFRLIVRGPIGVKEIERLIQKLEVDKEILAEASAEVPETE